MGETGHGSRAGTKTTKATRTTNNQFALVISRLESDRMDRLRVARPVLAPLDRVEAPVLDSTGKPLRMDLPLSENESHNRLIAELSLASFGRGVYSIELTAGAGAATERRRLTVVTT